MASTILDQVQVNIPFRMLTREGYLARFLEEGIHPEIGFDAITLEETPEREYEEAAAAFRENGRRVTCHAPFLDLSAGSPDPAVRRLTRIRFEQTLRAAAPFRPVTVVCHTGWDHRRYLEVRDAWVEKGLELWAWFAGALRSEGARMMMENVYERSPGELLDCCAPLRDLGVGVCLDTGHLSAFGEEPLDRWLDVLTADIGQLHLHDNLGERDEHLAPGRGVVDFPLLLRRLAAEKERPPVITLEPHQEEALREGVDYLERLWPWDPRDDSH
jgi:sugar phosphate isomerase/epimerase